MPFPVPPLTPGCPWYEFSQFGLPNVKWCEANLCSWIVTPANAWSNAAYLFVALYLYELAKKSKLSASSPLRFVAPAAAIVGITSFIHHMGYSFILQIGDFFGMYVFCFLIITLNLRRMRKIEPGQMQPFFWTAVFGVTGLTVLLERFHFPIQAIMVVLIFGILISETFAKRNAADYCARYFWRALCLLATGAVFSFLDVTRRLCFPDNHFFQAHALWHVLTALSLAVLFHHYRQFPELANPQKKS